MSFGYDIISTAYVEANHASLNEQITQADTRAGYLLTATVVAAKLFAGCGAVDSTVAPVAFPTLPPTQLPAAVIADPTIVTTSNTPSCITESQEQEGVYNDMFIPGQTVPRIKIKLNCGNGKHIELIAAETTNDTPISNGIDEIDGSERYERYKSYINKIGGEVMPGFAGPAFNCAGHALFTAGYLDKIAWIGTESKELHDVLFDKSLFNPIAAFSFDASDPTKVRDQINNNLASMSVPKNSIVIYLNPQGEMVHMAVTGESGIAYHKFGLASLTRGDIATGALFYNSGTNGAFQPEDNVTQVMVFDSILNKD